ncbi:MAG: CRISPR-associated helicase Cas3', partial [Spirulinaceae cyanobacterium RM2_2_10]|nr:CRISPR-associated helicase Cas3' [Spirulinaceae cyanobacterium RM2_2_10]
MNTQFPSAPIAHTPPKGTDRWHDLGEHLREVGELAAQFARFLGAEQLGRYAGLWHDLGKYHPDFQTYLHRCHAVAQGPGGSTPKSVPHAIHGAKWAAIQFQPLSPLIYGHHSGLPAFSELSTKLQGRDEQAVEVAYQLSLECARQAGINLDANADSLKREMACVQHDPLASELFLRLLFSCLVDADFLDTEEHFEQQKAQQRRVSVSLAQLKAALVESQTQLMVGLKQPDAPVNRVRAEVYEHCQRAATLAPGVFRLCVPTGGGKTRSSLAFALNHAVARDRRRVIVAVPYTSIIEQTVKVYREIFQALGEEAVLEHHSAVWNDRPSDRDQGDRQEDARQAFARARLIAQNWDAPLIVTTTVQLFDSLFANRPSRCRKLHNLVNSVIVLDEVQTLPIGLLDPILSVLRELVERYGVTVVLCTATQPALEVDNAYLQGFPPGSVRDIVPLAKAREHFRQLQRVEYEIVPQPWSWDDLVADLVSRESDRALIVLNTRRDALAVLQALEAADWPREHLRHLSTLLCGQHRAEVLQEVRQRLRDDAPCVLVSTQVVEAGVDLDFPLVYRAVGPLDRIVQAASTALHPARSISILAKL